MLKTLSKSLVVVAALAFFACGESKANAQYVYGVGYTTPVVSYVATPVAVPVTTVVRRPVVVVARPVVTTRLIRHYPLHRHVVRPLRSVAYRRFVY